MDSTKIFVESPFVKYTEEYIETSYKYHNSIVENKGMKLIVRPIQVNLNIKTEIKVPRLGTMLVGWGGNNGSTLTAAILANKHNVSWNTTKGTQKSNWYGSLIQSSTVNIGFDEELNPVNVPMKSLLPFVKPDELVVDGWDISSLNLADSMARAQVLNYELQQKLVPYMKLLQPRPGVYIPDFIASNQATRADNMKKGNLWEQLQQIQADIQECKRINKLDKIIVMWTANTERFSDIIEGVNDTSDNLLHSIKSDSKHIAPSTIYAVAAILEGCAFINGSPQNTFVPGCIQLAEKHNVFIAGDDFKSGQTKVKSVIVDFLISAGIKPVSIVSYNHLGNNDGKNLSSPQQFKSKEISKSNVVDDMVHSNSILYQEGERPDHCVVIKYVPYVGDSKRAMDEYTSEILLGGLNTIVMHNTCEDSLLAAPIILDLILLTELCQRITFKAESDSSSNYHSFHPILSILSYLCKAPLVPNGTPIVNSLFRQRACIENILKACLGLVPDHNMLLEQKVPDVFSRYVNGVSYK